MAGCAARSAALAVYPFTHPFFIYLAGTGIRARSTHLFLLADCQLAVDVLHHDARIGDSNREHRQRLELARAWSMPTDYQRAGDGRTVPELSERVPHGRRIAEPPIVDDRPDAGGGIGAGTARDTSRGRARPSAGADTRLSSAERSADPIESRQQSDVARYRCRLSGWSCVWLPPRCGRAAAAAGAGRGQPRAVGRCLHPDQEFGRRSRQRLQAATSASSAAPGSRSGAPACSASRPPAATRRPRSRARRSTRPIPICSSPARGCCSR